jgi:hypothetical protein
MRKRSWLVAAAFFACIQSSGRALADPENYPEFAQHRPPENIKPRFIYLDRLIDEIVAKRSPLIIDVRTKEEYDETHIKGSTVVPLGELADRAGEIPRDRLVVFY